MICPVGWHLPSDSEWEMLIKTLGGVNEASVKLKSTKGWLNELNGTNSTEMNVLPSGSRNETGQFVGAGKLGVWWSNTKGPSRFKIWTRTPYNDTQRGRQISFKPTDRSLYEMCLGLILLNTFSLTQLSRQSHFSQNSFQTEEVQVLGHFKFSYWIPIIVFYQN
jgi:hypothetical protein